MFKILFKGIMGLLGVIMDILPFPDIDISPIAEAVGTFLVITRYGFRFMRWLYGYMWMPCVSVVSVVYGIRIGLGIVRFVKKYIPLA